MKLQDLISGFSFISVKGPTDVDVAGLCHDSRLFKEGDLFMAIRGNQFDGHTFVSQACEKGAVGLVVEDERVVPSQYHGAVVKVRDTRSIVASLASRYFGAPSEKMFMVGVTGTNGKTTTTHMIENLLADDFPCGIVGTIDNHFKENKIHSTHTTPDSVDLQKMLSRFKGFGARAMAMEVSSHSLALKRVEHIHFDVGIFTNLTRDHLDFHKDMESYKKAKALLFHHALSVSNKKNKRAILNKDDANSSFMRNSEIPTWYFGVDEGDIHLKKFKLSLDGTKALIAVPGGSLDVDLPMIGLHNLYNAMAALGVGLHLGLKPQIICERLNNLNSVKGRLERVKSNAPVRVFVDYAHTDDALRNVLDFLNALRKEIGETFKIITVFGCGGDRDKGKRPSMMAVAEKYSDKVIVTSDNPRTEKPENIINDVLSGATPTKIADGIISVEPDRKKAIFLAVKSADAGDVILIAGKGHEDYQIIGTKKYPFDDIKIAKEALGQ